MKPVSIPQVEAAEVPTDALLLDVREDDEWTAGHAEGALHIPMGQVVQRLDEVTERVNASAEAGAPEADSRVYVVCRVGGRSAQVTQYLLQQGLDAVNVEGGMLSWEQVGRTLVGEADPAYVR